MKFVDINRRFTETVSEWIAKGYVINSTTMGGSQGEIARVDLTDGKEIIRVYLDNCYTSETVGESIYQYDKIVLTVGRSTGRAKPLVLGSLDCIWNSALVVLEREEFYRIGGADNWWGTQTQARSQQDAYWERHRRKIRSNVNHYEFSNDRAKKLVLPLVRREPKCKSVRLDEIKSVWKTVDTGEYFVNVRGKQIALH